MAKIDNFEGELKVRLGSILFSADSMDPNDPKRAVQHALEYAVRKYNKAIEHIKILQKENIKLRGERNEIGEKYREAKEKIKSLQT
jgi:hypothetical protein